MLLNQQAVHQQGIFLILPETAFSLFLFWKSKIFTMNYNFQAEQSYTIIQMQHSCDWVPHNTMLQRMF